MASWVKISTSSSSGMVDIGHGGGGLRSVGGASPWMLRDEKSLIMDWMVPGGPCREW